MKSFELLFKLLIGHALADFALQSDAMAKGKNFNIKPDVPPGQKYTPCWPYWMTSHALIHAGVVWIATGDIHFAITEFIAHFILDWLKCSNFTSPHLDQWGHFICKVVYIIKAYQYGG